MTVARLYSAAACRVLITALFAAYPASIYRRREGHAASAFRDDALFGDASISSYQLFFSMLRRARSRQVFRSRGFSRLAI